MPENSFYKILERHPLPWNVLMVKERSPNTNQFKIEDANQVIVPLAAVVDGVNEMQTVYGGCVLCGESR